MQQMNSLMRTLWMEGLASLDSVVPSATCCAMLSVCLTIKTGLERNKEDGEGLAQNIFSLHGGGGEELIN